ncbi:hypothetical protein SCT_0772 [Sulfuricella sp. T08]|uniref:DUF3330 domain-containing protein n=1 Tax=Sulfuricella sp. T08 TaxID=1632857 RepID=UPI00061796BD|nr:DUF3330 domain-containing protein [Sulfuricella sp. T08]GAO35386.1 hypothetical protein SCT_0772 [Sulfuricella sp. T08]
MQSKAHTGATIGSCSDDDVCVPLICDLCKAEIPQSAAQTFEGADYTAHFCGLGCMETWKRNHPAKDSQPSV